MRLDVVFRNIPPQALLIALSTLMLDLYPPRRNQIDADAPLLARDGHALRQAQQARLRRRIPLLIRITLFCAKRAHVDNHGARVLHPLQLFLRHPHIRYTRLRHGKRRRQIRLYVRLPLLNRVLAIHALPILPVRMRDAAVVDQAVYAAAEELCGFGDGAADVAHGA